MVDGLKGLGQVLFDGRFAFWAPALDGCGIGRHGMGNQGAEKRKEIVVLHRMDRIQAGDKLVEPMGHPAPDGLDGQAGPGGHVRHPHVAPEVFHQDLPIAVVRAQDLLDECVQAAAGLPLDSTAVPERVDDGEVAVQALQGFPQLPPARVNLLLQHPAFRVHRWARMVDMGRSPAELPAFEALTLQPLTLLLPRQGAVETPESSGMRIPPAAGKRVPASRCTHNSRKGPSSSADTASAVHPTESSGRTGPAGSWAHARFSPGFRPL